MAQEHYVLKCVACQTFQSQIVKKVKKWECKICSTKQSLMKVYGQGSGKDCRVHTQKLNFLKVEKEFEAIPQNEGDVETCSRPHITDPLPDKERLPSRKSKWSEYLDEEVNSGEEEHSPTENLNNVNLPDRQSNTKKRKISGDHFPKSNMSDEGSSYQRSSKQENVYKSVDLNPCGETYEKRSLSSTKITKNGTLFAGESVLYLKNEWNLDRSNCSGRKITDQKSSRPTLFFNQTLDYSNSGNGDRTDTLSENPSSSNHNNLLGDLYIKRMNYGSNDLLGQKAVPEKLTTKKPAESIFEQDCDLSDTEFLLEF